MGVPPPLTVRPTDATPGAVEHLDVPTSRLRLHVRAAGPVDGPLVVLLHGFPEHGDAWHRQLPVLAAAGFRAVAPDLRGYGRSDRSGPYDLDTLAADVDGLVRALGRRSATVVGHDWGAAVAFRLAARRPEVVERLVVMNGPHPQVLARELRRNPRQLGRSAYIALFVVPWLPERLLSARRGALLGRLVRAATRRPGTWHADRLDDYGASMAQPGAAAAALGYYRAAVRRARRTVRGDAWPRITCPTLVVWAMRDPSLGPELVAADRLAPVFAPGVEPVVVRVEDAGHFVQHEAEREVNAALLAFLSTVAPADRR
jgi:pimeloyl-ACP methyl ester carboxylesterase